MLSYKFHRTCNLMIQIEWRWFYSKILIFGQLMAKKWRTCPYLGIRFLGIRSGPIGLKFFMGVEETINYRVVVRNLTLSDGAYFSV